MKLFIKGKPEVITIDDYLPFYGNMVFFARRATDGDFWVSYLEKAFAKVNGNYEAIGGGWQSEAWRIMTGAPSKFYMSNTIDSVSAFNVIADALYRGYLVGADTPGGTTLYGLAGGHAHSVVGAYSLKDAYGNVQRILLRIRNPWGADSYSGPWYDGDPNWTANYKAQVPYVNGNDGYFFIEDVDFLKGFYYFTVNYYR